MSFFYQVFFYLFGLIAIASGAIFVTRRSPVAAVLWLVNAMINLAALYIMLGAHFVGAVQVLIYAGAIMVIFLFVVMLLNLGHADSVDDIRERKWQLGAGALALLVLAPLLALGRSASRRSSPVGEIPDNVVEPVAALFFRDHLLAFEFSSIVLLVAIVGAVVLAKRSPT